ncbi:hypothetical protein FGO68_gene8715 [Halteria grandinella]|uniref:Uncharacterized protein n=1 Tax=Halteria grandinella TaxID=5974 RepID=A0A8J8T5Z2_HALGN|nr:hypothetical protein FGO68_gene8715 [Halteria grandinella]
MKRVLFLKKHKQERHSLIAGGEQLRIQVSLIAALNFNAIQSHSSALITKLSMGIVIEQRYYSQSLVRLTTACYKKGIEAQGLSQKGSNYSMLKLKGVSMPSLNATPDNDEGLMYQLPKSLRIIFLVPMFFTLNVKYSVLFSFLVYNVKLLYLISHWGQVEQFQYTCTASQGAQVVSGMSVYYSGGQTRKLELERLLPLN